MTREVAQNMSRLPLAALAIVAVAAVAACSSSSSAPSWTYAPAASVTPAPSSSGSAGPSASASAPASTAPSAAASPSASAGASGGGVTLTVTAPQGAATAGFDPKTLEGPANAPFTVVFDNQDTQTGPHNWVLKDSTGAKVQIGGDTSFFSGPAKREYQIPALAAGDYPFLCEVHPAAMTGTLTIK
jgi:S-DNA-T family DNA segregation ATPase FtsK/SpoIIIE